MPRLATQFRASRVVLGAVMSVLAAATAARAETIVGFDDLPLSPDSSWNGSDGSGCFTSGAATFNNDYNAVFFSWGGWAYSNVKDTVTPGWMNQYAAYSYLGTPQAGAGFGGSGNYGVAYCDSYTPTVPTITIPSNMRFESIRVTNTTYAALSMLHGDASSQGQVFAKKFGCTWDKQKNIWVDVDEPDWFKLTITGLDADGRSVGSLDFYLADYRFADDADDYVVSDWTEVSLAGLSGAVALTFDLSSTDNGDFGMNTPAYFAADHLKLSTVPEPSMLALCGMAAAAVVAARRRRK